MDLIINSNVKTAQLKLQTKTRKNAFKNLSTHLKSVINRD